MKRKHLSDYEAMSGTGWLHEDNTLECPRCGEDFEVTGHTASVKCPECKGKVKIEFGQLNVHRVKPE